MSMLPYLIEPVQLHQRLGAANLLIVDMSNPDDFTDEHLPGAVNLPYNSIVQAVPPAGGLLPDESHLSAVLSAIGLRPDHHVVAYDAEHGGRAARLLWTLDVLGHTGLSMLNGGLNAWDSDGFELVSGSANVNPSDYQARYVNLAAHADKDYILGRLGQKDFALLDARSHAEFEGRDLRAERGGHIPGARNLDWTDCIDVRNDLRFKPDSELQALLDARGLQRDQEIVVYCQTHHRSSHSYWVLKHLGYPHIRGYAGSWSEWGNDPYTPIEFTHKTNTASPALEAVS